MRLWQIRAVRLYERFSAFSAFRRRSAAPTAPHTHLAAGLRPRVARERQAESCELREKKGLCDLGRHGPVESPRSPLDFRLPCNGGNGRNRHDPPKVQDIVLSTQTLRNRMVTSVFIRSFGWLRE